MTQQTRIERVIRFSPPVRFYAPLLVLVFGLATTWLEYELNLANDLASSLKDVEAQTAVTGDSPSGAPGRSKREILSCCREISRRGCTNLG